LGVIGGDARLVVVCSTDVRRQSLDESSAAGRGLAQALEPARERVCACAHSGKAPEFVDLVFSARPQDQRVTVEAKGDEDLDPELGPAFIACIGTVSVSYSPQPSDACDGAGKVNSFVYPVRLELGP